MAEGQPLELQDGTVIMMEEKPDMAEEKPDESDTVELDNTTDEYGENSGLQGESKDSLPNIC